MTRKDALAELIAKVEAGENLEDMFEVPKAVGRSGQSDLIDAFHGSLDAALALHETVLPGFVVHRIGQRYGGVWEVDLMQLGADGWHDPLSSTRINVWADTPARAWLLAILKALRAQEVDT